MMSRKIWFSVFACVLGVSVLIGGCGQSETNSSSNTNGSNSTNQGKLTTVTFATLPVADSATVVLAQKQGIFAKYGLDVKLNVVQTGQATTSAVVSGAAQFSQSNYATLFSARSQGVGIQIVSEATRSQKGFSYVVTGPDSPIKSPKDLQGKRIATSVIGGIGPLAINYWLKQNGIDYSTIQWVGMPFQDMGVALERHQVDAAWVVEPFATQLTKNGHARVVLDVFSGPTADMPIAGFATSESYARTHPEVVEAFKKSVEEAAQLAKSNPDLVRQVLPTFTSISGDLVNQIVLPEYPATTDVSQIQRVATAMNEVGFLKEKLDVGQMVWSKSK